MAEKIDWLSDYDAAVERATSTDKPILAEFSAAPMWTVCARLDAEVYSNPEVARFVMDNMIPLRLHAKNSPDEFQRAGRLLGVESAATAVVVDPPTTVLERIEGFVTPDEFLSRVSPHVLQKR